MTPIRAHALALLAGLALSLPHGALALTVEAEPAAALLMRAAARETAFPVGTTPLEVVSTGAGAALSRLCAGKVAVAAVDRPITAAERAACSAAKIELLEMPLAEVAPVLVVNPRNNWADRMTAAQVRSAFDASARGGLVWKSLDPNWPDAPVKLYLPAEGTGGHAAARAMAAADPASARLRIDAVTSDSPTILADAVARDRDGLALIDAATYAANRARLKRVALSGAESLRQSLTLYVSTQALGDAHFVAVLRHWMSRGARMAAEAGFEAAPAAGQDEPRRRAAAALARLPGEGAAPPRSVEPERRP